MSMTKQELILTDWYVDSMLEAYGPGLQEVYDQDEGVEIPTVLDEIDEVLAECARERLQWEQNIIALDSFSHQ